MYPSSLFNNMFRLSSLFNNMFRLSNLFNNMFRLSNLFNNMFRFETDGQVKFKAYLKDKFDSVNTPLNYKYAK